VGGSVGVAAALVAAAPAAVSVEKFFEAPASMDGGVSATAAVGGGTVRMTAAVVAATPAARSVVTAVGAPDSVSRALDAPVSVAVGVATTAAG